MCYEEKNSKGGESDREGVSDNKREEIEDLYS